MNVKMKEETNMKIPENLVLTAILSGSTNLAISLIYTVMSIVAIVYRANCEPFDPENMDGDQYFWNVLYRVYIQSGTCAHRLPVNEITHPDTVFLLLVFTLVVSICVLISSSVLIAVAASKEVNTRSYIHIVSYVHVGACIASFVVDLTFATHFGIDYNNLSDEMKISLPGLPMNYQNDMIRLGAMFLMGVSLKGFIAHAINIVLLVLLVVFAVQCQKQMQNEEHSIHKLGVLSAYNEQKKPKDLWSRQSDMFVQSPRSQRSNPTFTNDDDYTAIQSPRSPTLREQAMSEYTSRFYERPEPWQHRTTAPAPPPPGARPFSYLEEVKRPPPLKAPPPPVPAPDYSPLSVRRLKPALKPAYK